MGSRAMLAHRSRSGTYGANPGMHFGLLRAFARALRRSRERSESGRQQQRNATGRHGTMDTQVVDATGDLCDTRVLRVFHRRCEEALSPGRRCLVVDLADVTSADTKLVATLVTLLQRAQALGVPLELIVSSRVYGWITLCRVERLLRPTRGQRRTGMDSKAPAEVPQQERSIR